MSVRIIVDPGRRILVDAEDATSEAERSGLRGDRFRVLIGTDEQVALRAQPICLGRLNRYLHPRVVERQPGVAAVVVEHALERRRVAECVEERNTGPGGAVQQQSISTCGEKRDGLFPGVPTMVESGFPNVIVTGWTGLLGPAGMPRDAVTRLQSETRKHLLGPELKEALLKQGTETVGSTPEQFAALIKSEANKYSRVIKRAGLEFTQ